MTTLQSGQVAVVTGAATGIGLALARAFAGRGLMVALADRDAKTLEAAVAALKQQGAKVIGIPTDVSDREAVKALRDKTIESFGAVHVLCNNAGLAHDIGPIWKIDLAQWRRMFEVNFWGVVHGMLEFVPGFVEQGSGHVVNTASMSGLSAVPGLGDYGTTKHAVVSLTEILRADLDLAGATQVGTTVLCPSVVGTAMGNRAVAMMAESQKAADSKGVGSGPDLSMIMQADDFATAALKGIEAGWLYVLPSPGSRSRFTKRIEAIAAAFELQQPA